MTIRGVFAGATAALLTAIFISVAVQAQGDAQQLQPYSVPYQPPAPTFPTPASPPQQPQISGLPPSGVYYPVPDPNYVQQPPVPQVVPPPVQTSRELKANLQKLKKEELQLADLLHKQLVAEIEQLKKQESELAEKMKKCRAERETLEKELNQSTPDAGKKCGQPQHGCTDADAKKIQQCLDGVPAIKQP
jgi:hypothetical protein